MLSWKFVSRTLTVVMIFAAANMMTENSKAMAQSPKTLAMFQTGRHLGTAEEAIVGVTFTKRSIKGEVLAILHGNGLMLRSDGFVLLPLGLYTAQPESQRFDHQSIDITLNPGTDHATQIKSTTPRFIPREGSYFVIKLSDVHQPAMRTLLPDTLKPGDEVQAAWCAWDEKAQRFSTLQKQMVKLGEEPKKPVKVDVDAIPFIEPLENIPPGAVILGQDGLALGMIPGTKSDVKREKFISFSMLNSVTNCVSPIPTPDSQFKASPKENKEDRALPKDPAVLLLENAGKSQDDSPVSSIRSDKDMVSIPGGPVFLAGLLQQQQVDMERAAYACVAPFRIDKYEVTNQQYFAWISSLPDKVKQNEIIIGAYKPLSWSEFNPPFPAELANVPVLGVPMAGAQAYAKAQGKRLPTPYEWCLAAFGPKGEDSPPDWVKKFVAERTAAADRVQKLHLEFLQERWQIIHIDDFTHDPRALYSERLIPGDTRLHGRDVYDLGLYTPWLPYNGGLSILRELRIADLPVVPVWAEMASWSKQTVITETNALWNTYIDPLYVLPVGSRAYDVSPYGVSDMLMNAEELVLPPATEPNNSYCYAYHLGWKYPDYNHVKIPNFYASPKDTRSRFHSLSRLISRSTTFPPADMLTALTNTEEAREMLRPLSGWELYYESSLTSVVPWLNSATYTYPSALRFWTGKSAHYHREIGKPIPLPTPADQDYSSFFQLAGDGKLTYVLPVGFRCAR